MPEDLRQLGTPVETKEGAQSKADTAQSNAESYTDSEISNMTSSDWSDYEIQKDGTDGTGIINFKT